MQGQAHMLICMHVCIYLAFGMHGARQRCACMRSTFRRQHATPPASLQHVPHPPTPPHAGITLSPNQVKRGTELAKEQGVPNASFQVGLHAGRAGTTRL